MADVYLAVVQGPLGFNKLQVLKRLRAAGSGEDSYLVAMFIDEARLAARLNHPNVVQTNEVNEVEGEYFIAMEYLEGQPLSRVMHAVRTLKGDTHNGGPLDERELILLRIVADALAGLHYAHELKDYDGTPLNIVHRDVSPHNIFVTYDGQTKILDFGIAKATTSSSQTSAGVLKGKMSYMAPEQARCQTIDRRADLFIIGIVLWEILAGRRMWKGVPDADVMRSLLAGRLPSLQALRPDVPPDLARVCDRALALGTDGRYTTAAELRSDLLACLERAGKRPSTEEVGQFISSLFAEPRARFKTVIERQITSLRSAESAPLLDMQSSSPQSGPQSIRTPQSGAPTPTPPSASTSQSNPLPVLSVGSSTETKQVPQHPTPNSRRLVAVAGACAVVTAAATMLLLRARAPEAPPGVAAAAPQTSTMEAVAAPPLPSTPPPADTSPQMIEVRISAVPASAKLFLDDAALDSNPFSGKFRPDGARHWIRVEAPGHRVQKELVLFDDDLSIEIDLERKTATRAPVRRQVKTATQTAPEATPSAEPEAPTSPNAPAGKPKRNLSAGDPWAERSQPTGEASSKPKRRLSDADPWNQ